MPKANEPQEQMTIVTIDAEMVRCQARTDELKLQLEVLRNGPQPAEAEITASEARINGLKDRLKVLRKERKKLESGGLREDGVLGGRLEEGMSETTDDPKLGGTMGSGSTL